MHLPRRGGGLDPTHPPCHPLTQKQKRANFFFWHLWRRPTHPQNVLLPRGERGGGHTEFRKYPRHTHPTPVEDRTHNQAKPWSQCDYVDLQTPTQHCNPRISRCSNASLPTPRHTQQLPCLLSPSLLMRSWWDVHWTSGVGYWVSASVGVQCVPQSVCGSRCLQKPHADPTHHAETHNRFPAPSLADNSETCCCGVLTRVRSTLFHTRHGIRPRPTSSPPKMVLQPSGYPAVAAA